MEVIGKCLIAHSTSTWPKNEVYRLHIQNFILFCKAAVVERAQLMALGSACVACSMFGPGLELLIEPSATPAFRSWKYLQPPQPARSHQLPASEGESCVTACTQTQGSLRKYTPDFHLGEMPMYRLEHSSGLWEVLQCEDGKKGTDIYPQCSTLKRCTAGYSIDCGAQNSSH